MKLLIASNNPDKIKEIQEILGEKFQETFTLKQLDIDCDPEENGQTFLENAQIKAREIAKHTNLAVVADDTGLCVHALNNQPGIHSARYAGNHDHAENRKKLLRELKGKTDRSAHFETVVVLRMPDGTEYVGYGRVDGYILEKEDGENGFGYDSLFYCNELKKSFGKTTNAQKHTVSHRARALNDLLSKVK